MTEHKRASRVKGASMFRFLGKVIKDWTTYTAVGGFLLYLFGYLALRFHITALGVNTDLGVLDEQYLFAGAHFVVYVASVLPWLALVALVILALGRFMVPKLAAAQALRKPAVLLWWSSILAIGLFPFLNRCFAMSNIPLAGIPADLGFLSGVLKNGDLRQTAFLIGLLLAAGAVCGPVIAASRMAATAGHRTLFGIAVVLAALTALMVPVNFGTLILPYPADQTSSVGKVALTEGQKAWVIWRGKDWVTYLVRSPQGQSVVDVPVKSLERVDVVKTDSLIDLLAAGGRHEESGNAGATSNTDVKDTTRQTADTKSVDTKSADTKHRDTAKTVSWLDAAASFLGVERTPRELKGQGETASGELWISPASGSKPVQIGSASNLRSPIFQPGGKAIYALQDDSLVRVTRPDGKVAVLGKYPGVIKLVGFRAAPPQRMLTIFGAGENVVTLALLRDTGGSAEILAGKLSTADMMVKSLLLWERRYGDVFVTPTGRDINVTGATTYPKNISRCGPDLCSQPSYSVDTEEVVYVRTRGK